MNINNADELKQTARGKGGVDRKRGKKVGERRKREVESGIASFLHCSCNGKLEINKTYNSMTSGQPKQWAWGGRGEKESQEEAGESRGEVRVVC